MAPIADALVARGKNMIFHASNAPEFDGTGGFPYFKTFIVNHPDLNVLVPHLGMAEPDEFTSLLPYYPHLYFDLSATMSPQASFPWVLMEELLDDYPHRFLFGTDLPINQTKPKRMIQKLLNRGWPTETYRDLFNRNAKRFLRED